MNKINGSLFLLASFLLFLMSCDHSSSQHGEIPEELISDTLSEAEVIREIQLYETPFKIGSYQEIEGSEYLIFPYFFQHNNPRKNSPTDLIDIFGSEARYSNNHTDSYGYTYSQPNSFANLIFHHPITNETHYLLKDTNYIIEYYTVFSPQDSVKKVKNDDGEIILQSVGNWQGKAASKYILYVLIKDTNKDNEWNNKDARQLWLSDKDGTNFIPISPENQRVYNWKINKETGIAFIHTLVDTNLDNKFSSRQDETRVLKVNLNHPEIATSIFSDVFIDELKLIYPKAK